MTSHPGPITRRPLLPLLLLGLLALGLAAMLGGCELPTPRVETACPGPLEPTAPVIGASSTPPPTVVSQAHPPGYSTPAPIIYQMYDWGTDFQNERPELGPIGSINFVTWEEVNPAPGAYNWGPIERLLEREASFKVTLLDGTEIAKPVVIQIFAYLSTAPNWAAADFYDATPTWVYDQIDQANPGNPRPTVGGRKVGYLLESCSKKAVVPMYDSSIWRQAYYDMIRAFGKRFEGHPQVTSVSVLTGIDGETHATKDWYCAWQTEVLAQQAPNVAGAFVPFCTETMTVFRQAFPRMPLYLPSAPGSSSTRRILAAHAASLMPPIGLKHCGLSTDLDSHQGYGTFVGSWDMVRTYSTTLPIWVESVYAWGSREAAYWSLVAGLHYHPDAIDLHKENLDAASPEMLHFVAAHLGVTLDDTPSVWTVLRDLEYPLQTWGSGGVSGHAGDWCFWLVRSDDAPESRTARVWRDELPAGRDSIYGRQSRRTLQGEGQYYVSLDVNDGWPFLAQPPAAVQANGVHYIVNVTLLNHGDDTFALQYVKANGALASQVLQKGPALGPVDDWVSVRFEITDGYLDNNLPGGVDLRLSCQGDGDEFVHMMQVVGGRGSPLRATATPTPVPRPSPTVTPTPQPGPTYTPQSYAGLAPTPTPPVGAVRYDPSDDTFIDRWAPDAVRAKDHRLSARQYDVRAAVLKFDLASLPTNAIVDQAILSVGSVARTNPQPLRLAAYKVYRAWSEAACNWVLASSDDAWAVPGCNDTLSDRSSVSVASALVSSDNYWYNLDVTALVREWVSDPLTNAGLVLRAEGQESVQYDLYSSNSAHEHMRPRLWVVARIPTSTPTLTPSVTCTATATATPEPTQPPTATVPPPTETPTARPYPLPDATDTIPEPEATATPRGYEPPIGEPTLAATATPILVATLTATPADGPVLEPSATPTTIEVPAATPVVTGVPSLTATLPSATPAATAIAPTATPAGGLVHVVLRAGEPGVRVQDAHIDALGPDGNFEGSDRLVVRQGSTAVALIWFDLTGMPAGASVKEASLHLYAVSRNQPGELFAGIARLIRHWDPVHVTWLRSTATDGWAQSGANGIGHDRAGVTYASAEIGAERRWVAWDVSTLVQEWVSDPESNRGLAILGEASAPVAYELASSEWGVIDYRPRLEIAYDLTVPSPTRARSATPVASVAPSASPTGTLLPPTITPAPTATPARAQVVLQQGLDGYAGVADTYLDAWHIAGNHGRSRDLYVRQGRDQVALLHFDLASVPPGARVTEALLSVYVDEFQSVAGGALSVYELRRSWSADAANWLEADLGALWSGPGASAPESDRAVAALASVALRPASGWVTLDVRESVQRWVRQPTDNRGLLLSIEGQASPWVRLASSQADVAGRRPKLVLRYTLLDSSLDDLRLGLLPGLGAGLVLLVILYLFSRRRAADEPV